MTYDELDHTSQYGSIRKLHLFSMEILHKGKWKFYTQWILNLQLYLKIPSFHRTKKKCFTTFLTVSNYQKIKRNLENSDGPSPYIDKVNSPAFHFHTDRS